MQRGMHTSCLHDLERLQVCGFWTILCFVLFPIKSAHWRIIDPRAPSACQATLGRPRHFLFCLEIQLRLSARRWGWGWRLPQCTGGGTTSARVRPASVIKGGRWRFQNAVYFSISLQPPLLKPPLVAGRVQSGLNLQIYVYGTLLLTSKWEG